jgi:hypothetical protein
MEEMDVCMERMPDRQPVDTRAKIETGIAELERGEGIPGDGLNADLERLKAQPE